MITENKRKSRVCDVVSVVIDPADITLTNHKPELGPAALEAAAAWLMSQSDPPSHLVPVLKERFNLTGLQACQAIALARDLPRRGASEPNQGDEA